MAIQLHKPYKIVPQKHRRYEMHYEIPADRTLVVPTKSFDTDLACDVYWQDASGDTKVLNNIMFMAQNLTPINALVDFKLNDLWQNHVQTAVAE